MRSLPRALFLWLVLAGPVWLLASQTSGEMQLAFAAFGLIVIPLSVWLTVRAAATLPSQWAWRVGFWTVTAAAWFTLVVVAQGRAESHPDERQNILIAFGLAAITAVSLAVKARALPTWRVIGEVATGAAILAIGGGGFAWCYDLKTRSIAGRAEARWNEIGLPMAEFEKTMTASRENAGSAVARQVLSERVSFGYYKDGTIAAKREPAIVQSKASEELVARACEILSATLPPSDDLDLPAGPVAAIEPVAPALEADYRRILAAETPTWASDPHDGYLISVPNFLGVRKFAQLTAADAMRRLSGGDQEGAARAITAGLRVGQGLRQNPTLVSLMIHVAVDGLLAPIQVRLPAVEGGFDSVAEDVDSLRAELVRNVQIEAWACLRLADQYAEAELATDSRSAVLPRWIRRIATRPVVRRMCAIGALDYAEQAVIQRSPATLGLPDLGTGLQEAVYAANPSSMGVNTARASMRIHATLLLREQTELIRNARACLAQGRPVESRDSAVLPGVRWELIGDAEKNTVATRLTGAPAWIVKNDLSLNHFWLLPLDGSVAWQFRPQPRTASQ